MLLTLLGYMGIPTKVTRGVPQHGDMFPGDTIELEISGIGLVRNCLVAEG